MSVATSATASSLQSLKLSFLNGGSAISQLAKPSCVSLPVGRPASLEVRAMKFLQGRVVCAASDKTVAVEVVRLAPHPKYKRRVRKKKKYQAHDPDNVFQVGDFVQLEKTRPISKTKTFLAVPIPTRKKKPQPTTGDTAAGAELGLPLESAQA